MKLGRGSQKWGQKWDQKWGQKWCLKWGQKWWLWGALFALAITLATVPKARKLRSPDFHVFYVAARHVIEDPVNLYRVSPDRYLYPPAAAIALTPFAFTDHFALHQWSWHAFLGVLVALLGGVSGAALGAMALLTRYLANTFGYGQINLVVVACLAAAGGLLAKKPKAAGALWAFAAGLKVYPAVLAPAFLRRENRAGLWGAAAGGLVFLLLPFVVFGPALATQLYGEFLHAIRDKGLPLHSHNQSFSALLLRLFTDQEFELHGVGYVKWGILSLPPSLLPPLAMAAGLGLTAFTWRKAWRAPAGNAAPLLSAAAFSVLFLSHLIWKDYFLLLYFPLRELLGSLPRRRAWVVAGGMLALVTLSSPDILGPPVAARLDAAGVHLWGAVLLWTAWMKWLR